MEQKQCEGLLAACDRHTQSGRPHMPPKDVDYSTSRLGPSWALALDPGVNYTASHASRKSINGSGTSWNPPKIRALFPLGTAMNHSTGSGSNNTTARSMSLQ